MAFETNQVNYLTVKCQIIQKLVKNINKKEYNCVLKFYLLNKNKKLNWKYQINIE